MKSIFVIMVDTDGTMRSSCDSPVGAFFSREAAQKYLDANTKECDSHYGGKTTSYCGGYEARIREIKIMDENYLKEHR